MAKKSGGGRRESGAAGAAPAPAVPEMGELRAELSRALTSSVDQTVDAVCARFDEAMGAYARRAHAGLPMDPLADYDMYHGCCVRLVRYIEANMETSPDFAAQMERIILACHSNAAEHVLRTVATKDVWFRRRRADGEPSGGPLKPEKAAGRQPPPPPPTPPTTRSAEKRGVATRSADKGKGAATRATRSSDRGRVATRSAEKRSAGTRTRSGSQEPSPAPKRPRRAAAARVMLDTESSEEGEEEGTDEDEIVSVDDDEEDEEEEEEEEEEEADEAPSKKRGGRRGRPSQPHYEQGDELLSNFKDAIGELCYQDRRTPEQTKFFKDRLRQSIVFVDAQLCKPPQGQFCSRNCKKLRAIMCNGDKPCKNKTCRIWHDVEVHTDCCENAQCEFKNRILLRETMHKIEHAKQDLQCSRTELQAKRKQLVGMKRGEDQHSREKIIDTTLLEDEISQLEQDLGKDDEELSLLTATRKAFWDRLNEIGVKMSDDVADDFPDFDTHYTSRRPVRKSTTPQKSKQSVSPKPTPPVRQSERTLRRRGAGPHDESKPAVEARSTRRSTRSSHDTEAQVIDVEEEETKDGHDDGGGQDTSFEPEHDTSEEASERLTEVTSAVGFTLRTNPAPPVAPPPAAPPTVAPRTVAPPTVAPAEAQPAKQAAEKKQDAVTVARKAPAPAADPEPAQAAVVVAEEREVREVAVVERRDEAGVNYREEVAVEQRVVEVAIEQHTEATEEHREEPAQREEPTHEARDEPSQDHTDDPMDDEEENAFSAMNSRWPGGL